MRTKAVSRSENTRRRGDGCVEQHQRRRRQGEQVEFRCVLSAGGGRGGGGHKLRTLRSGGQALARRLLFLPLAHGVGVAHDHLVHPGERLGEQHRALEEAQVTSVERQGEDDVGLLS